MTKTKIQNRIIGLEYVKGSALLQNPKTGENIRTINRGH